MANMMAAGGIILLLLAGCSMFGGEQPEHGLPGLQPGTGEIPAAAAGGNASPPGQTGQGTMSYNDQYEECLFSCSAYVEGGQGLVGACNSSCRAEEARRTGDVSFCSGMAVQEMASACYAQVAINKGDRTICTKAPGLPEKSQCEAMFDSAQN